MYSVIDKFLFSVLYYRSAEEKQTESYFINSENWWTNELKCISKKSAEHKWIMTRTDARARVLDLQDHALLQNPIEFP